MSYREQFIDILEQLHNEYYDDKEIIYLAEYIKNYISDKELHKICHKWNGETGKDYIDENQNFRDKISVFICLNRDLEISDEILNDLVREIGRAAHNSWGAPEYVFILAEELLIRAKSKYVETFGKMLFSNMDTYGACLSMDFKDINLKEILEYLNESEIDSKLKVNLIEYFNAQIN